MQQLSGMDASFVYFETPRAPMHVGGISIYDPSTAPGGTVSFERVLEYIGERLHLARTFRQRMVQVPMGLDHPWWIEDPGFDLEFHVRELALPPPGDWSQLCAQAARLHARPLDLDRPLWELYVVSGLDSIDGVPPGSFALIQKTHHAAIDGVSGMEMTSATHGLTPEVEPPPPPEQEWKGEDPPTDLELLARAAFNNATRPMHFARVLARSTPGFTRVQDQLRRRQLELPPSSAPRTRFNDTVTAHRVIEARRFDLAAVRKAKAAVPGATVNDAVLSVVGGALRRYLAAKGERPVRPLLAMAPVSVRTDDERSAAGNQVSGMVVSLGTDVVDPLERLAAVSGSSQQSKEFNKAIDARTLTEYSQFIPGGLAALGARNAARFEMASRTDPPTNTVVTNVPGPQQPLYFAGARMVTMIGMGPIGDGMGLMHPVTSYCGELVIAATSCPKLMPDPAFYAECLGESFDELVRATT